MIGCRPNCGPVGAQGGNVASGRPSCRVRAGQAADTAMHPCTYWVQGGALVQAHGCWGAEGKLGDSETDSMMETRGNWEI